MAYRIILGLFIILIAVSCSTPKRSTAVRNNLKVMPERNTDLMNITMTGTVTVDMNGQNQSGKFKMMIAGTDSVSLSIFGPFSIVVGKLYSTPLYFMFYNSFGNELIQGKPEERNLMAALNIPIAYNDLVHLTRSETPADPAMFKFVEIREKGSLFRNDSPKDYIEYVLLSGKEIVQYQRKTKDGKTVLDVLYDDYEQVGDFWLPARIYFIFKQQDGKLTLNIDGYKINEKYSEPFKFNVPEGVEQKKF